MSRIAGRLCSHPYPAPSGPVPRVCTATAAAARLSLNKDVFSSAEGKPRLHPVPLSDVASCPRARRCMSKMQPSPGRVNRAEEPPLRHSRLVSLAEAPQDIHSPASGKTDLKVRSFFWGRGPQDTAVPWIAVGGPSVVNCISGCKLPIQFVRRLDILRTTWSILAK